MKYAKWFVILLLFLIFTAPAGAQEVSYYEVPEGAQPHDAAPAPDGSVWYMKCGVRSQALTRLVVIRLKENS